jgi:two-component system alkaline phosphatase synthesis response regulator PhoP
MKPKVLVVDDEADFVQLLEYTLAGEGYELFTAGNGMEALHEARRILPDVILLDLMLPDLDGFSVYEILRSQPSTSRTPIIVVSALSGPSVCGRSIDLGASHFFKKPVDLRALGESVRTVVEEQRQLMRTHLRETDAEPGKSEP